MALSINFLSKTGSHQKVSSGKKIASNNNSSNNVSGLLAGNSANKAGNAQKTDMASMNTSDLIKHVYNNNVGDVNIKNHQGEDKTEPDNVALPLTVEYGDQQYSSHGKNFKEMVEDISKKTGDSTCKVETELKRKYTTVTGGSLNMNA